MWVEVARWNRDTRTGMLHRRRLFGLPLRQEQFITTRRIAEAMVCST